MASKPFTCPNGHTVANVEHETPCCDRCDLVATWFNRSTGEVHTWTDADECHESCRSLRDQMDAAFDNQYFN